MSNVEHWIDARLSEAEDALIGEYGEPEHEAAYTNLLAEIVGPFADYLREAVEAATPDDVIRAVSRRYHELPPLVHTDTPRTVYSRILSATLTPQIPLSHGQAVHLAALALALVVAVDRAELVDVTAGREE